MVTKRKPAKQQKKRGKKAQGAQAQVQDASAAQAAQDSQGSADGEGAGGETAGGARAAGMPRQYRSGAGAYEENPYRVILTGGQAPSGGTSATAGGRAKPTPRTGARQAAGARQVAGAAPAAALTRAPAAGARQAPTGVADEGRESTPDFDRDFDRDRRAARRRRRLWPRVVACVLAALVLVAVGVFAWYRWFCYDDAAQMQGTWLASDGGVQVVIDGSQIWLSDDVGYAYTLNTTAKTISYTFGELSGGGRYRFSLDRTQLVIVDGEGYWWGSTLVEDVQWMLDQAVAFAKGEEAEQPVADDTTTVLDWYSADTTPPEAADDGDDEAAEAASDDGSEA